MEADIYWQTKLATLQRDKGVSKNTDTPKWMVKIMEHSIKMDDLGVPLFLETPTRGGGALGFIMVVS